jgi:hypothetical protein
MIWSIASSVERGAVRILDAEDEGSAVVAGEKPVEKRCPGPAHMKIACGARSEPDPDLIHGLRF